MKKEWAAEKVASTENKEFILCPFALQDRNKLNELISCKSKNSL